MDEAKEAVQGGADFITFGPVYETPSKKQYGHPVGLEALRNVCQTLAIAVFGLGGIDSPEKVQAVKSAGAYGVSMISAIVGASDVTKAAEKFIKSWENNL
jgi:thiamine-phosphate pyrophosphorylase